jgi:hypothetical protein
LPHLLCVGGIISLSWFSKELKNNLSKNNWLCGVILILLIHESIFIGWGDLFPIVLVSRYKLSLCHNLIKPDLISFSGIWCLCVWVAWPRDHEIHIKSSSICGNPLHSYTPNSNLVVFEITPYNGGWEQTVFFFLLLWPLSHLKY